MLLMLWEPHILVPLAIKSNTGFEIQSGHCKADIKLLLLTGVLLVTRGQQRGFCDEVRSVVSILFVILPKSLHEWGAQIPLLICLLLFPRA